MISYYQLEVGLNPDFPKKKKKRISCLELMIKNYGYKVGKD